ncbi:barstar family protein [Kovacikia minuta CCNUW1]|uniref:barstar family protein n=1 Tax=Kovacikia minuta TaxID=2931930 RepID=UPI001CCFFE93|nr:barstar family protein [Kovacikia minuta]UBF24964.1 barstar family protein [Kovacikia minuta CCNUW1]
MTALDDILQGNLHPGIYRLTTEINLDAYFSQLREQGWKLFSLEGERIANKSDFLQACAQVMHFPPYFGNNWDAFEECMTDPGIISINQLILLYNHPENFAQNEPNQWKTAVYILRTAIEYWSEKNVLMYVLFNTNHPILDE